jgi:hypothetical protein
MKLCVKDLLILGLALIFVLIVYNFASSHIKSIRLPELFQELVGLNPLTTYDDLDTINYKFEFDNLPNADTHLFNRLEDMPCHKCGEQDADSCDFTRSNGHYIGQRKAEYYKKNCIRTDGVNYRREILGSNYASHPGFLDAMYDRDQLHLVTNPFRQRYNTTTPYYPQNIYFDPIVYELVTEDQTSKSVQGKNNLVK